MFDNQAAAAAAAAAIEIFQNGNSAVGNAFHSSTNNNQTSGALSAAMTADKDFNEFMPLANVSGTNLTNAGTTTNTTSAALNAIFDPSLNFGNTSMSSFNAGNWNTPWYHNFANDTAAAALLSCSGISGYSAAGLSSIQSTTSTNSSPYSPYLAQFSGIFF